MVWQEFPLACNNYKGTDHYLSVLEPVTATARIPKFSWEGGEMISFEIWYHNDMPKGTSDTVHAFLEIGRNRYPLLDWQTGYVEPNRNKMGPTVNYALPYLEEVGELKIVLVSENAEVTGNYRLKYRFIPQKNTPRTLNT